MNILFVCTGNVSRSYLAEMLLKHEVEKADISNILVSSRGLFAYPGSSPDPHMVDYLQEKGIETGYHEARQLRKEDIDWADLILAMEREQKEIIEGRWPEAVGKVDLLGRYNSNGSLVDDIMDPFGMSLYHYRLSQAQIAFAVESLVKKVLTG
jgi:protein-tyrosine-phosphatase